MVCVSSDGLSVLGHSLCVSVQTGCALQCWHQSNIHQTLQKSFLSITDLICNKAMHTTHQGQGFERIFEERDAIFSSHVFLKILIPDLAWANSDTASQIQQVLHLNTQLPQVKLNRFSSLPSMIKIKSLHRKLVRSYHYGPSQPSWKVWYIFTSFPKDITRDYLDGELNLDVHIIQKTAHWKTYLPPKC